MSIIDTHQVVRMKQVSDELQLSGAIIDNKIKYVEGAFYFKSSPNGLGGFQGLTDDVFNWLNDTTLANYLTDKSKEQYVRSEECSEGKECVSKCRTRWARMNKKKQE